MYRPPENSNRVKSIKSKFENIENDKSFDAFKKNATRGDLKINRIKTETAADMTKQNLSRQFSDPAKRNIKRTPAFRFDKSVDKNNLFQRNAHYNRSYCFDSSALKNNCDSNKNIINRTDILYKDNLNAIKESCSKPVLIKSKSSHDFAYIRSKFDRKVQEELKNVNNQRETVRSTNQDKIASLYTEPVPKALRNRNNQGNDIHSADTLKICDKKRLEQSPSEEKSTFSDLQVALTDTLKAALNRPLPTGPAPVKPPRTFEHTPVKQLPESQKNSSFLHNHKEEEDKVEPKPQKHDPRYMLNKLENALRNNKIKTRKQVKKDASTTSGEDSDDSVLFKSKSKRELPTLPSSPSTSQNSFNFNCLNGITSCKTTYETIKEPNALFFVDCRKEEPVYAEPFGFVEGKVGQKKSGKSLYYMSTLLLDDENKGCGRNMSEGVVRTDLGDISENQNDVSQKQMSTENSSLSSFTSDLDSSASTPVEEFPTIPTSPKIKQLINTFETKQTSVPKIDTQIRGPSDSSHRIEDLKMSLQKTLERCFDGEPIKDGSDESESKERKVSVDKIISKFQTYVKTMPKYQKPKLHKDDRLFYCCLIVGWDTEKPQIKFKFPEYAKIPHRIEDLCYPEAASGPLDISDNAQCYSLVITNDKGERTFGYCRRVIPEGWTKCIPLAYCILSKYRAPRFYKRILMELESRHGIPDKLRDELISQFYFNKFPRPGESIKIDLTNIIGAPDKSELVDSLDLTSFVHVNASTGYGTLNKVTKRSSGYEHITIDESDDKNCCSSPSVIIENNGTTELILTLHHDTRYEEADLKPLHKLPPDILLKIFASLLLERKVILISCVISKLSCCVDALQSILYPFSWPHTFIPILPQCLWDVVESPTPVICGILSVAVVNNHKIEHGIVVDLDEGCVLSEEGDENSILSDSMKKAWNQGFALANTFSPDNYVHSVYLSDAYVKVFIASLKHYKNHIIDGNFDKEGFIRNGKTKGIRRFLKWFTETTMFITFIDSISSNPESLTLFDTKIEMYGSDESNVILSKLMEWKK